MFSNWLRRVDMNDKTLDKTTSVESARHRPYFIWDYDLTEEDVRTILHGDNEYEKIQMMVRILESARWDEIWRYLTLAEVQRYWPQIYRHMRREVRDVWAWAMEVWARGTA